MLVFFLLNFTGGSTENFAQAVVSRLTGDFRDQFPVRVVFSFRKHNVFNRVQFGLIFR